MNNKVLYIICGVVAVVLVGVLLLGLISGGQPGNYFGDYKGNGTTGETEQTTDATDEGTKGTDGTDATDGTNGSGGTDNGGGNPSGGNGAVIEDTDIKIPIGNLTGPTNTDGGNSNNSGTENTENTEATESTGSSGKIPGNEISFDDLLDKAGK